MYSVGIPTRRYLDEIRNFAQTAVARRSRPRATIRAAFLFWKWHLAQARQVLSSLPALLRSSGDTHTLKQTADTHIRDAIWGRENPVKCHSRGSTAYGAPQLAPAEARIHELAGALLLLAGCDRLSSFVYHGMSGIGG